MLYHLLAFVLGIALDLVIGDPHGFPHPIRLIGSLIAFFDRHRPRGRVKELLWGIVMSVMTVLLTGGVTLGILVLAYRVHVALGVIVEAVMTCYIMAARSLQVESMKVYHAFNNGDVEEARRAVSMIVGRDTDCLTEEGIIKAAVETVAENTSDGVIAPMIYTFLFGPVGGFVYKAINTMDSMTGYHNDKYEYLGKVPARLDDVFNFIPARISGLLIVLAAFVLGRDYSGRRAFKIFIRDRYNHKSPNSAQCESACAGALGLRLAGDAVYFGKVVKKPFIGDAVRPIENKDIARACTLMYGAESICLVVLLIVGVLFIA
ncbi:adenosylcobinamide-phosphate synthase CbiB [Butyrivibrio proteoclasticus]|uniref:adenosylcobinamide-phosphate synthase CbiB n=1 Tax=Butyrivibrio proteoclasticus TaxID=43305 RepID=UPI00047A05F9|nr:adenosylcobinamide-phosphate synthase CbiB [Butyrivibrio proteoclasticus]